MYTITLCKQSHDVYYSHIISTVTLCLVPLCLQSHYVYSHIMYTTVTLCILQSHYVYSNIMYTVTLCLQSLQTVTVTMKQR
jgi:hypothetical protein